MKQVVFILMLAIGLQAQCAAQILKKKVPDKLVVLTFDDAPVTHYTYVAPLLKQYGFGATFYVCEFPPNYQDTTKYMSWKQIQQLGKMGFEVANHTHTHKGVSKLPTEKLTEELKYIEDTCVALGITMPITFAYPGYDLSPSVLEILQERGYVFARAGGSRAYDPLTDHPYLIPSWATTDKNPAQIMEALKQAKDGKIVILTIHGVPDYEHPWVTTLPEQFKTYLNYLKDQRYTVVSLKDLQEYIDTKRALQDIKPDFQKSLRN